METKSGLLGVVFAAILSVFVTEAKVVALLSVPHVGNVRTHTNVGRALTAMGHDAYVAIPQFMLDEKLVNVEGIHVIPYGQYLGNFEESTTKEMMEGFWQSGHANIDILVRKLVDSVPLILSDKYLLKKLQVIRPDLVVLYDDPMFRNIVILPYMLNVSFALMTPFYSVLTNRISSSLSTVQCYVHVDGLRSVINRMKNVYCQSLLATFEYSLLNDSMVKEFAPHRPQVSVNEIYRQAEIYLIESDHILDYPKPQLPNIKMIGGTAPTSGKPLKDPFKKFVEGSKNKGVAVVTFGSSIVNITVNIAKLMSKAFELQDLDVVWRTNYKSSNPNKVLTSTWVPQNDLLAHSSTKLFVSHCGANGQYEALYHGVPLLCLPIFGDQFYNAHRTTTKGFGLEADIMKITAEQLAALMKEVSRNTKYSTNIKKASAIFRELYQEPDKTAAYWIDHVMKYGGSYMRSASQDLPLYQFLMLDIVSFLIFVLIIFVLFVYGVCRYCCSLCHKRCKQHILANKSKDD